MSNQRYKLLTTLIVSALHPNEPQQAGGVWEPTNAIDIQEAEYLVKTGYAEEHTATKKDVVLKTWLQQQDEAKRKKAAEDAGEEEPATVVTTPPAGEKTYTDEELLLVLDGNVENVEAELEGLTLDALNRLDVLEDREDGGKKRKGVHDAIAAAIEALEGDQE